MSETQGSRYRALTLHNVHRSEIWSRIGTELRESIRVVGSVFPFRTNTYVTGNLIDWSRVPEDPLFQLTFPQREMLEEEDYQLIRSLRRSQENRAELRDTVESIRVQLNPQPAGQLSHNVPELDGQPVDGIQHKYRETVLFFPAQGQTCHAYCSYCFRWPQFCSTGDMKFMARNSRDLVRYLERHREVSDLLVTGGDPMVMKTRVLGDIWSRFSRNSITCRPSGSGPRRSLTGRTASSEIRTPTTCSASSKRLWARAVTWP